MLGSEDHSSSGVDRISEGAARIDAPPASARVAGDSLVAEIEAVALMVGSAGPYLSHDGPPLQRTQAGRISALSGMNRLTQKGFPVPATPAPVGKPESEGRELDADGVALSRFDVNGKVDRETKRIEALVKRIPTADAAQLQLVAEYANLREFTQFLVQRGISVRAQSPMGAILLHKASEERQLAVVKYLVELGANLNCPNVSGDTPLLLALKTTQNGGLHIVRYLVDAGADPNITNRDGQNAFFRACRHPSYVVEFLVRHGATIVSADLVGLTPLHEAASGGRLDTVNYLIHQGFDVNAQTPTGWSVLHAAIQHNAESIKIVERLLAAGAQINARETERGHSVLFTAAAGPHADAEITRLLVTRRAAVHTPDNDGVTPILAAMRNLSQRPKNAVCQAVVAVLKSALFN